ncbi:MAG TPA: polysaccharide deacetylase family protein [Gemmatales bacterium]|nr:polysaccharide deacetylase family protein [Gemmatales bacterium]
MLTLLLFLLVPELESPWLIIRGDDMGFSHSGNLAIRDCYRDGIVTTVEVIVPSPWFPEAVKMLAESDVDVGIHLALSSEWENIKWRPVSQVPSLVDENGYLFPMIFKNKNYPRRSLIEQSWQLSEIEKEFRAQIELGKKHIPRVSHLSGHMGCPQLSPQVRELYRKLAKEYQLDIHPEDYGVQNISYQGKHVTISEKWDSFMKLLDTLQPGKTYLFVEHPGYDDAELRAIHHVGYENVAQDRQGVTDLFLDARIKAVMEQKKIKRISYKDLTKK